MQSNVEKGIVYLPCWLKQESLPVVFELPIQESEMEGLNCFFIFIGGMSKIASGYGSVKKKYVVIIHIRHADRSAV